MLFTLHFLQVKVKQYHTIVTPTVYRVSCNSAMITSMLLMVLAVPWSSYLIIK